VGALDDSELMGLLTEGAAAPAGRPAAAAAAAAPAAPEAAKPKGIQIKRFAKPLVTKPLQAAGASGGDEDEQQPGTPSTQVSGEDVA
jgi:hypothetical protein